MKILVCISVVPDTTTKIKLTPDKKNIEELGIQWVINPWDELSLTRALDLKDDSSTGVQLVRVAHVGPASGDAVIRKALAMGADDAIRVDTIAADAYATAFQLSEAIRKEPYDIILCGIESSDHNGSTVGGMLAEFLDIPSVSAVSSLQVSDGKVIVTREIDGGREILHVPSPFVAIVQKGISKEPRIASMRGIMMSRTKPIHVHEAVDIEPLTTLLDYEMPKARAACRFIDPEDPAQLVALLQNEAKVF